MIIDTKLGTGISQISIYIVKVEVVNTIVEAEAADITVAAATINNIVTAVLVNIVVVKDLYIIITVKAVRDETVNKVIYFRMKVELFI